MRNTFYDIPGFEGFYKISKLSEVKSLKRKYAPKDKLLKPILSNRNYLIVSLSKNGIVKTFGIHQLMAMTFLNHTPNGNKVLLVDHKDNIKSNNKLHNLQVITVRENNSKDQFRYNYSSKYIGVSWCKNKWQSQIKINGKGKYLGLFDGELEASEAYKNALLKIQ